MPNHQSLLPPKMVVILFSLNSSTPPLSHCLVSWFSLSNPKPSQYDKKKRRSLIFIDLMVEIASWRSLYSVRWLNKLPLITTSQNKRVIWKKRRKKSDSLTQPRSDFEVIQETSRLANLLEQHCCCVERSWRAPLGWFWNGSSEFWASIFFHFCVAPKIGLCNNSF